MAINALNSGARVWLADLEDANTPHWRNVVGGQVTLYDAVRRQLAFTSPEGKDYAITDPDTIPVIVPRPRGWHLAEEHLTIDGRPAVGALARTSTCRSWSHISRPGCGTRCSPTPRRRWRCRTGRSGRPC
jgi:malate synthase